MSDQFKALILNQEGESFSREIKSIDKSFLKHGDVTVKVEYSGLNYKDALILKNGARLVKEFPHIPGIDFSGTVEDSQSDQFKPGDEVITQSLTFVATANAASHLGAIPHFIDIEENTLGVDPLKLEIYLTKYRMKKTHKNKTN